MLVTKSLDWRMPILLKEGIEFYNHVINIYTNLFNLENNCIFFAMHYMNCNSTPYPDSFERYFVQANLDILEINMINSVNQFFEQGWILPNLNLINVTLIPKQYGVDSIEQYISLALPNFQFKIITKIIIDKLTILTPKIVSEHQGGFIRSKHIDECIKNTSKATNLLDKKFIGGSMDLKIDIRKAFGTVD